MDYSYKTNEKRRKRAKNRATKTKNKVVVIIFRTVVAAFIITVFAGAGAVFGAYMGIIKNAPSLSSVPALGGTFTTIIYDQNGVEVDRLDGGESREYATIDQIPDAMKYAFISLEDERFYSHNGVDIRGAFRAAYQSLTGSTQGGSTITQQLIKNRLGIKNNSIETKLQEQVLAVNYEKELTASMGRDAAKDYILEQYMNIIGEGNGTIGVQAASLFYFGKDVSELSIAQCACLAAITQNPTGKDPTRFPEENRRRMMVALDNMLKFEFITQYEYDKAVAEDVYAEIADARKVVEEQPSYHSFFVDAVISAVSEDLQSQMNISPAQASQIIYNGGLSIYITQDPGIQAILDDASMDEGLFPKKGTEVDVEIVAEIKNTLTGKKRTVNEKGTVKSMDDVDAYVDGKLEKLMGTDDELVTDVVYTKPQPQFGMCVYDHHTGWVKAIAGQRGVKQTNRAFNRATDAKRQPGSVFKILASYAPAIDLKVVTPGTVIDDTPFETETWSPNNWYSNPRYRGLSTVRMGITNSMNVVTVKNMNNTGTDRCFEYIQNFGFTTLSESDRGLATALGGITNGVTQVELSAAFGAIANGGILEKPIFYTKVLDHEGQVILENLPQGKQVLRKTSAFLLTDMMRDVLTYGTGGKARFSGQAIAGKTGTTSETRDLMFAGFTPYYTATIYLGYDTPKTISNSGEHLLIWKHVMSQIHENLPEKDFEQPEGITTAHICTVSGKLAAEGLCDHDPRGGKVRTEYYEIGTAPTEYCDVHREYTVCNLTGKLATDACPEIWRETFVGFVRPIPYDGTEYIGDSPFEVPAFVLADETCDLHIGGLSPFLPDGGLNQYPGFIVFPSREPSNTQPPPAETYPQDQAPSVIPPVTEPEYQHEQEYVPEPPVASSLPIYIPPLIQVP